MMLPSLRRSANSAALSKLVEALSDHYRNCCQDWKVEADAQKHYPPFYKVYADGFGGKKSFGKKLSETAFGATKMIDLFNKARGKNKILDFCKSGGWQAPTDRLLASPRF